MSLSDSLLTYVLTNARVVALVDGGGAVIEHGDIEYREGRVATIGGHNAETCTLAPVWAFSVVGAPVPDASELGDAQIVIEGDHEDQRIELRGTGAFGYTDTGHFEGEFYASPVIILDHYPEPTDEPVPSDFTADEWGSRMGVIEVKAPEQFRRAQRNLSPADAKSA